MDELKALYRQGLIARIGALEAAAKGLSERSPQAAESIHRIAHSLHGSGATYGFPEISAAARALEDAREADVPALTDDLIAILQQIVDKADANKARILIVGENPDTSGQLMSAFAAPNREISVVPTAVAALQILDDTEISLLVLDIVLPDMDGRNLLIRLRERTATAALPIFVLSSLPGAQPRMECFALGADEYFEKPIEPRTLAAAAASKLQRAGELSHGSRRDPLTGLLNRAALKEALERLRLRAGRNREPLSLALLDLDRFKQINDMYGHTTGDAVLRGVGRVLSHSIRRSDLVARWGGEEFVILLPAATRGDAAGALQKVLEAVRAEPFEDAAGRSFQVTFSAGVTQVSPEFSGEAAVTDADRFLYQAKAAGRNRIAWEPLSGTAEKKKILFADDDELTATLVKTVLAQEGFEVMHFPDGVSALKAARETSASLAILDVMMPAMSGFELLQNLRRIPSYAKTPIVMLTSMGSENDIVRGFDLGADDYIVKPFLSAEFQARVRRLVKS